MGILYLVATPIGNLEDISIRAMKTLASVDGIACEDTRKTGQLLKLLRDKYPEFMKYNYSSNESEKFESKGFSSLHHPADRTIISHPRLIQYYEQVEDRKIPEIVTALKNGLNIALVSDAGTPTVSDPGFRLVRECVKEGIKVESIPGPVSPIVALTISGLPTDKFLFIGYPPHKGGKRIQLYKSVLGSQEHVKATVIMFEAPHKIIKTLEELKEVFGDIEVVLARELTKIHEEILRGTISDLLTGFTKPPPKGEFVVLFNLSNLKI